MNRWIPLFQVTSNITVRSILLFSLMTVPASLLGQSTNPASRDTSYLGCGVTPPYVSKTVRSRVFVAPGQKQRAYAEVTATAHLGICANYSKLYVQSQGGKYSLVFLGIPTEFAPGNGIKIIGWSADGLLLLFDVLHWPPGDANGQNEIWVYRADTGIFAAIELGGFVKKFDEGCVVDIHPAGFSDSKVLLKVTAKQDDDEVGNKVNAPCAEHDEIWSYNLSNYQFKLVSPDKSQR